MSSAQRKIQEDRNEKKLFQRERTLLEITEMICGAMQDAGVSRKELASRLGMSKGAVSQMLNGDRNLTIKSISDMLFELDQSLVALNRGIDEPVCEYVAYRADGGVMTFDWNDSDDQEIYTARFQVNFNNESVQEGAA